MTERPLYRHDLRGTSMPSPSALSSLNDFVIRFAKMNGIRFGERSTKPFAAEDRAWACRFRLATFSIEIPRAATG